MFAFRSILLAIRAKTIAFLSNSGAFLSKIAQTCACRGARTLLYPDVRCLIAPSHALAGCPLVWTDNAELLGKRGEMLTECFRLHEKC